MISIKKILAITILLTSVAGVAFLAHNRVQQPGNKISVAASYYPLYDFAKQIGGKYVTVTNIAGNNEPHEFDPSPQAIIAAQKAKVFVYNGGHLEPWVDKFLNDYTHTAVKASKNVATKTVSEEVEGDEHEHQQNVVDPHFWLDPVLAQQIVRNIQYGLSAADPAHSIDYANNANVLVTRLSDLDTQYRLGLAQCQQHTVISSHQAMSYLGSRYNFNISSIAGLSPEDEPSPAKLSELSDLVRSKNIQYVFFESLASQRLADTIATETGAKTLVFNPIERVSTEDQNHDQNYITIQQQNLANLRTALACKQ